MRKRTAGLIVGALLTGAAVGAVTVVPASAETSDNPVTSRIAAIKNALSGLVSDGTLTQAQADKVAAALDQALPERGHGGRGMRFGAFGATLDAAAKTLGTTTDALRTDLRSGKTLAAIAKDRGVSVDALVRAMVAAAEKDLDTAVSDGRITQAQADAAKSGLTQRITDEVNGTRPAPGFGRDRDHHGFGAPGPGGTGGSGERQPAPSAGTSA